MGNYCYNNKQSGKGREKFIELQELDTEQSCPCRNDCQFTESEIDIFSYRLKMWRCTEHGEIYGKSMTQICF